jgi:hypothetical protein
VRGKSDLGELAKAGEKVLKELPQSGTAPRIAARVEKAMGGLAGRGGAGGIVDIAAGMAGTSGAGAMSRI